MRNEAVNRRKRGFLRRGLSVLLALCLLLSLLPIGTVAAETTETTEASTKSAYDEASVFTVEADGSASWAVQNVNFFEAGQTILIDCYTIEEFNNESYAQTFEVGGAVLDMNTYAKASFTGQQPQMENYTAFVIEYLNRGTVEGAPEYFVESIVDGAGKFSNGHSMINLAPETDMGFVFYIPTALLTEQNTPKKGDVIATNFWHGSADMVVGHDKWYYPEGADPYEAFLGNLYFMDRPVEDSVLDTVEGDFLNATVKMFDYRSDINATSGLNEYFFWNGNYGRGAAFESVDGWGAELVAVDGNLEFANPYEGGNITWDAYHGYNRDPVMAAYLSEKGYPVILDKTPGEDGIATNTPIALDTLFDGTYQVGSTMTGGGGLFQKDEKGYYYYDSLQNAAYFDGTDFTLYKNLIIRPWADSGDASIESYGNFLPLNELTASNITRDGYVFNDARDTIMNLGGPMPQGSLEAEGMSEAAALKVLASANNRLRERGHG